MHQNHNQHFCIIIIIIINILISVVDDMESLYAPYIRSDPFQSDHTSDNLFAGGDDDSDA